MNECKSCINAKICGHLRAQNCNNYDVPLTRGTIFSMITKNPQLSKTILSAVKSTYHININPA